MMKIPSTRPRAILTHRCDGWQRAAGHRWLRVSPGRCQARALARRTERMSIFALHDPLDPRQQIHHAHTELLLERFAALGEADRTVIELVALAELPIRIDSLAAVLRLTGLDPAWREHGVGDL